MKLLSLFLVVVVCETALAQNSWVQKADFGGGKRTFVIAFSIGNKGYAGIGHDSINHRDFWEYDPSSDSWAQKANFGGSARYSSAGFSIGNKGYIGAGYDHEDFWEYNPATNSWIQRANFGGGGRSWPVGFSIGNKGYMGMGMRLGSSGHVFTYNDFWEYDPSTNTWLQKSNFPGGWSGTVVGFSIGNKGYINGNTFWEYDPSTNLWEQKAGFSGAGTVGFSIGTKGYLGTGYHNGSYSNEFWEYDPSINTWEQKANFGGQGREGAFGFSIGNKGYIGAGDSLAYNESYLNDFWEYTPDTVTGFDEINAQYSFSIYPNPTTGKIVVSNNLKNCRYEIYNTAGKLIRYNVLFFSQEAIDLTNLESGIYFIIIHCKGKQLTGKIVKE